MASMVRSRTDFSCSSACTASMMAACAAGASLRGRPGRARVDGDSLMPIGYQNVTENILTINDIYFTIRSVLSINGSGGSVHPRNESHANRYTPERRGDILVFRASNRPGGRRLHGWSTSDGPAQQG